MSPPPSTPAPRACSRRSARPDGEPAASRLPPRPSPAPRRRWRAYRSGLRTLLAATIEDAPSSAWLSTSRKCRAGSWSRGRGSSSWIERNFKTPQEAPRGLWIQPHVAPHNRGTFVGDIILREAYRRLLTYRIFRGHEEVQLQALEIRHDSQAAG